MIENLAQKIDICLDNRDISGLNNTILECQKFIEQQPEGSPDIPLVQYFISNAYSGIRYATEAIEESSRWAWRSKIRNKELLNLRKCTAHTAFKELDLMRQCQALTNLGNLFSNTGRVCLAIDLWDRALAINPYFSMALFSKAEGLVALAGMLYDESHIALIYEEVYALYSLIEDERYVANIEPHVVDMISRKAWSFIEWWSSKLAKFGIESVRVSELEYELDSDPEINSYHRWCLSNRLFINPLNDISDHPVVNHDIFMLPDMKMGVLDGPYLFAMMQQMKQEFLSARFMLYQGIQSYGEQHFSDETMQHVNTLDYPINGLFVEMIKTAFKTSYSILDKVGTFINEYFKLDISDRNLSFRNVWYVAHKRNKPRILRKCFDGRQNLPLRGLYWLSKDLMNSPTATDPTDEYLELEAEAILKLRNRMEHGYVRVVEYIDPVPIWKNDFATKVTYDDLVNKTFLMMKTAREALLYLGLAVAIEERAKFKGDDLCLSGDVPFIERS